MAAARAEIHSRPRLRRRHRAKPLRHQSSPTHASDTFQQVAERRSNSTRSDEPLIHYHRAGEFVFLGKQNRVLVQSGLSNTASCSFGAYPHVRFGSLADARVLIETLAVALQPAAQFRQRLYAPSLKFDALALKRGIDLGQRSLSACVSQADLRRRRCLGSNRPTSHMNNARWV
jgi:hypothetical protein